MRRTIAPLIAVASLLLVAEASAGTQTFSSPPSSEFTLRASNGYRIVVERLRQEVSLLAIRNGKGFAFASYAVRGRASEHGIEANFGKLGRVSVRLRTEKIRRRTPDKDCTGKVATTRSGVFVGTIRFKGEGGYTTVDARRARGQASSGVRVTCPFSPFSRNHPAPASAGRRHPPELITVGPRRGFTARAPSDSTGLKRVLFEGGAVEQRGRISIFRFASVMGGQASYAFADDLSTATVRPPSPFEGEATFQREGQGRTSWSGILSASLPGRDRVRLAGPRFTARLQPYASS
jgi:hypothetical protein